MKNPFRKNDKVTTRRKLSRTHLASFAVAFAMIGVVTLALTSASSPFASVQPENALLAGCVEQVTDTNAANGKAVRFGGASCDPAPQPPPTNSESFSKIYIVDVNNGSANDSNPGTADRPLKSITKAVQLVKAGEAVQVKAGTYTSQDILLQSSGTKDKPIVISAFPGDEQKVIVTGGKGIRTLRAGNFVIRGFKVVDVTGQGIYVVGGNHMNDPIVENIVIENNWTVRSCSSGISVWGTPHGIDPGDYQNIRNVKILNNRVESANHSCANEYITVTNGVNNVETAYNVLYQNGPDINDNGDEGVDYKAGVDGGSIHHNKLYDMLDNAIYIDGGRMTIYDKRTVLPYVKNIDIYANEIYNSDQGGIVMVNEGQAYTENINVYNNLIYNVRRNGLSVYNHYKGVGVSSMNNIKFVNNTVVKSGFGSDASGDEYWAGIGIDHPDATNILVRNNIVWGNASKDIRFNNGTKTTIDHNLCRESFCETKVDPQFSNAAYELKSTSPAINKGVSNGAPSKDYKDVARPQGGTFDLGAYER